jgi:hypothetical protein
MKNRLEFTVMVRAHPPHYADAGMAILLMVLLTMSSAMARQAPDKAQAVKKSEYKCTPQKGSSGKSGTGATGTDWHLYVGANACQGCHVTPTDSFEQGSHGKEIPKVCGIPAERVCETCHGPAREHVDTGGDTDKIVIFRVLSAKEVNKRCLDCHLLPAGHKDFFDPDQDKPQESCLSCHTIHHPSKPN